MPAQPNGTSIDVIPGGVLTLGESKYPDWVELSVRDGDGCYLTMDSGEEYLDYLLGSGPLILGHSHPKVSKAIQNQAEKGVTYYLSNGPGLELAQRVVQAVPCADQIKFTSSGTEATYAALRLARAYTGNEKVLKFEGGFHGWHDAVLKSSSYADTEEVLRTTPPDGTVDSNGVLSAVVDNTLVGKFNDLDVTREIVRRHADGLACIIAEPLMRTLPPEDGFLSGLREICDKHGIVLIFDEVVTGFRIAWGGGQEYYGVEPDLATYGKAIGGGTPIGAVCGREDIMTLADPRIPASATSAIVAGTMSGNPLSTTAGNATLDVLETSGTYDALNKYASRFRDVIDEVLTDSPLSGQSLGEGPIVDYVITDAAEITDWRSILQSDSATKKKIDAELLSRGILQQHGGKRYISTEHGPEELDKTAEAFKAAVESVS